MKAVAALCALLALSACADRLTPAPGEHPQWPQPSPPRPSTAPLPFTTNYAPFSGTTIPSPPANADGSIPYAVRGQTATPAAAAQAAPACHAVPPVQVEGKTAAAVCQQADGSWSYVTE